MLVPLEQNQAYHNSDILHSLNYSIRTNILIIIRFRRIVLIQCAGNSYKRWQWYKNPRDYISADRAVSFQYNATQLKWSVFTTPMLSPQQQATNRGYDE